MNPACIETVYHLYRFPACVNTLVFLTDIISLPLTFRFTHARLGYFDITKTTASDGKFTFTLADLPKEFAFNPYIGPFGLSVLYNGNEYRFFYLATGKQTGIAIEAQNNPASNINTFIFDKFIIEVSAEEIEPEPGNDSFPYTFPFILI